MPRSSLHTAVAVILISLGVAAPASGQVDPQKPRPPASIWRQPRNAPESPEDAPVPLETNDPRFHAYFSKVRERIKATWTYPSAAGQRGIEGEVVVTFRIAKDGHLVSVDVWRSSGATILDDYSVRAVQTAAPFPPVPDDVAKNILTVQSTFRYSLTSVGPSTK
jgi:periplasmic protein TonB